VPSSAGARRGPRQHHRHAGFTSCLALVNITSGPTVLRVRSCAALCTFSALSCIPSLYMLGKYSSTRSRRPGAGASGCTNFSSIATPSSGRLLEGGSVRTHTRRCLAEYRTRIRGCSRQSRVARSPQQRQRVRVLPHKVVRVAVVSEPNKSVSLSPGCAGATSRKFCRLLPCGCCTRARVPGCFLATRPRSRTDTVQQPPHRNRAVPHCTRVLQCTRVHVYYCIIAILQ
jgi:hypothetical protein